MNMKHNTTDGMPLDFSTFKAVDGVMYPANAIVPRPFCARPGRVGSHDVDEALVHEIANSIAIKNDLGKQSRQSTRRMLRKKGVNLRAWAVENGLL